jgi:hypothetical protein
MEKPVLNVVVNDIQMLRQFEISPEIEPEPSPTVPDIELSDIESEDHLLKLYPYPEDFVEKTLAGLEYVSFNGCWYRSG